MYVCVARFQKPGTVIFSATKRRGGRKLYDGARGWWNHGGLRPWHCSCWLSPVLQARWSVAYTKHPCLCSSPSPLQFYGSGWWELHIPALASTTLAKTHGSSSFSHSSLQAPTACSAMRPSPNFGMTHKILLQQASDSCPQFSLGSEEEQSRWMPCSSSSSCMFLHTVTVNGRSVWWICKGIEFFSNVQLQQGCFLLVLSSSFGEMDWAILQHVLQQGLFLACIVEKGIELLWNVHCNKVCFALTLSRLLRELGYYWMCIAKWVVSCLGYRNYSKKWIKLLLNLYCNKVVCCLWGQKKCLKSIVRRFSHLQYFFC